MTPAASARSLTCRLGETLAIRELTFDIDPGERIALLGANGSGKTTLLRALAGLLSPTVGSTFVCGSRMSRAEVATRRMVGYSGHNPHQYDDLTVRENLALVAATFVVDDASDRIDHLTHDLALDEYGRRRARELSRGLQQRLALAIALLPNPRLLLLDEPEAALDGATRARLGEIIDAHAGSAGFLFATHDLDRAAALAKRALVLDRGALVGDFEVCRGDGRKLLEDVAGAVEGRSRLAARPRNTFDYSADLDGTGQGTSGLSLGDSARQLAAIVGKDLRLEWRTREVVPALSLLSVLMVVAFSLAFVVPAEDVPAVAAGVLWASLAFATVVGGMRVFAAERDQGTMEALILAPISRAGLYLAKASVNFLFLAAVGLFSMVSVTILFDVALLRWDVAGLLILGSAAFASVGSLYGAVAANVRARELLIPVLLLPVSLPVLIGGVAATLGSLGVTSTASQFPWAGLLAAFCAIFAGLAAMLFEHILGD